MIPIQLTASFHKSRRIVQIKRILDFLLDVICSWDFSASLELIWSCVDDFESVASAMLARPLHICDAISILVLHRQSCGLLLSNRQLFQQPLTLSARSSGFLLHGALLTFMRPHTLQFGPTENWVNRLCFPPDLFEVGFAGGCAEGGIAGRGTTGDKIIAKNNYAQDFSTTTHWRNIYFKNSGWKAGCAPRLARAPGSPQVLSHPLFHPLFHLIPHLLFHLLSHPLFSSVSLWPLCCECGRLCLLRCMNVVWSWCLCVVWCGVVWCGVERCVWSVVFGCVWCLCCWCFLGVWRRKGCERGEVTLRSQSFRSQNVCSHAFNTHIQGVSFE